ncbi:MAG: N-6 DNA methylase [Kineosporiaceae bacterium]|nr:N-6 DNA methylase [Aeromicrobium sp.]
MKKLVATATATDLIKVSDFALARLSAGYGRSGGDIGAVESNISGILAAAAMAFGFGSRVKKSPVVYDSSCGIGETLIKTIEAFKYFGPQGTALGVEIDERVSHIASTRMRLRDIAATIQVADTLSTQQFSDEHPDIIIVEPPFGSNWVGVWNTDDPRSRFGVPPTRKADLAWVADAACRLKGSAGALVLTTMGALSNGGAEERVRADLVRSGTVETIIALPPNLLQYTSIPLALWVLRAADTEEAKRGIMLLDASTPNLGAAGAAKRTEWVRRNIAGWVVSPLSADPIDGLKAASVYLHELLDAGGMDLTPTRWTSRTDYSQLLWRLNGDSVTLVDHVEDLERLTPPLFDNVDPASHVVTVREMTEFPESREAKLWAGRGASNGDVASDTITSRDISAGVLRAGRTDVSSETGFWTEPEDIVFTTMHRVKALVDTEGGHHIGNGVYALRLEKPSRFDPEYVAQCLAARWNERHQKGGAIKHAKPGDLEIPLLPLDNQTEWTWSFRQLRKFSEAGRDIAETAERLAVDAQNTLRFGHAEAKR